MAAQPALAGFIGVPVPLPNQPNNPAIHLPPAPHFPPTPMELIEAKQYRKSVERSFFENTVQKCMPLNVHDALVYENALIMQATAAAGLAGNILFPPWAQQLAEVRGEMQRSENRRRGRGRAKPFEIIHFTDGTDPTQLPHVLPPLHNVDDINNLDPQNLIRYLTGYGIHPLPPGIAECKEHLKIRIGAPNI